MSKYRYLKPGETIKIGDQQDLVYTVFRQDQQWERVTKEMIGEYKRAAAVFNKHHTIKVNYMVVDQSEVKMFRRRLHVRTQKIKKP